MSTDLSQAAIQQNSIRSQFQILNTEVNGKPLVYLDNAASTQKPDSVIDEIARVYREDYANVHRGVHRLSQKSTDAFERARTKICSFINAAEEAEIILTKGTTESINLLAWSFTEAFLKPGDTVLLTELEHHANLVPWQFAAERKKLNLEHAAIDERGDIDLKDLELKLQKGVKILALCHVSNSLGTHNPVKEIIELAHRYGAKVLIDAAQSVVHMPVDVQELNCDFLAFSSHKVYGPGGVGVLYGKKALLEEMPPYQGGGEMISEVEYDHSTFADLPFKFEAGTPNIADTIAFVKAIEFIEDIGWDYVMEHERRLLSHCLSGLKEIEGIRIIGEPRKRSGVIAFLYKDHHHLDLGTLLDNYGVAIRTGHHCTQPLMKKLGITGTCRVSFAVYNTLEEVVIFLQSLKKSARLLG